MNESATIIACPTCRRALRLPGTANYPIVRCPICSVTFEPGCAPSWALSHVGRTTRGIASEAEGEEVTLALESDFEVESIKPYPVKSAEWTEYCPLCENPVPPYLNQCRNCRAEFVPREEPDEKPWEECDDQRRDLLPDRGNLLLVVAMISLCLSPLTFCTCWFGLLPGIFGIGLGIYAAAGARRDLKRMNEGVLDRLERGVTQAALWVGVLSAIANLTAMLPSIYAAIWMYGVRR